MKKFLVLCLTLVLVFSLASCKSKEEKEAELEAELNKMAEDLEKELEKELEKIDEEAEKLEEEMEAKEESAEAGSGEDLDNGEIDYSLTDRELVDACAPLISVDPFADADNLAMQFTNVTYDEAGDETNRTTIELYISGNNYSMAMSDYDHYQMITENFDLNKRWIVNDDGSTGTVGVPDDPNATADTREQFTFTYNPDVDFTENTTAYVSDIEGFKYLMIEDSKDDGVGVIVYSLPEGIFYMANQYDANDNLRSSLSLDVYDVDSDYSDYVLEPEGVEWTQEQIVLYKLYE